jgi:hypothetical protein
MECLAGADCREEDRRQLNRELRTLKKGTRPGHEPDPRSLGEPRDSVVKKPRAGSIRSSSTGRLSSWSENGNRRLDTTHGQTLEKVRQLLRLQAIGPNGAWVYVNEFFGWRQFRNRKEVGTARRPQPGALSKRRGEPGAGDQQSGSRHIRAVATEMKWCWLRYHPRSRLSRGYQKRFGRGGTRAGRWAIVGVVGDIAQKVQESSSIGGA